MPDPVEARAYLQEYASLDLSEFRGAMTDLMADAYGSGALAASSELEGTAQLFGEDANFWDTWTPGNIAASDLLDNGGFQSLLSDAGITIKGIGEATLDRMGTALAEGAARGDSVDTITNSLADVMGDTSRAYMIANTELNRATSAASIDVYQANGIEKWDWVLSPDACDECQDMESSNPHEMDDDPPPLHPNCRCAASPVVVEQEQEPEPEEPEPEPEPEPEAEADPFPEAEKMEPQGYAESVQEYAANVGTGASYKNNCHFVINAMEMRARGYDVVAAQTYKSAGRYLNSIQQDWREADGSVRKFRGVIPDKATGDFMADLLAKTEDWPPGARGFMNSEWKNGAAHVYNIYKDAAGKIHLLDGQVSVKNAASYLNRSKVVRVMRVDDLVPVPERLMDSVATQFEVVNAENQLAAAEKLLKQYKQDFGTGGSNLARQYQNELYDLETAISKLAKQVAAAARKAGP